MLEVFDHCFHGTLHHWPARRSNPVIFNYHRPLSLRCSQLIDALLHNSHGLVHFLHPHKIAVVAVAVLADRNVEIELGIAFIGLRLAQVPDSARAAYHDSREAPSPSLVEAHHTDVDVTLLENAVLRKQDLDVLTYFEKGVAKIPNIIDEFWWQVPMHAADTKIVGMHPSARGALIEHH